MTDNGSCYRAILRAGLQAAEPQAHPHQALHAEDQRQGRALHPDRPARMGLRQRLQHVPQRADATADLATSLQLASPSRQLKGKPPISRLGLTEDNLLRRRRKRIRLPLLWRRF